MTRYARWFAAVGIGFAASLLTAPASTAEDVKPTGKALEFQTAIDAHIASNDTAALAADVAAIAKYAPQASDANERSLLLNLVGRAIKKQDDGLRTACLKAFEEMKDAKAWEYFGFLVNQPDPKKMDPILQSAINSCAVLTPEGAVLPLVAIYRNSDALPACVACLKAMSKYKNSKQRAKVLSEMIDEVKSVKPGVAVRNPRAGKIRSGEAARTRYEGLSGPMVESANALTGQSIGTAEDWFATWDGNKSDLDACFMEPIDKKK